MAAFYGLYSTGSGLSTVESGGAKYPSGFCSIQGGQNRHIAYQRALYSIDITHAFPLIAWLTALICSRGCRRCRLSGEWPLHTAVCLTSVRLAAGSRTEQIQKHKSRRHPLVIERVLSPPHSRPSHHASHHASRRPSGITRPFLLRSGWRSGLTAIA